MARPAREKKYLVELYEEYVLSLHQLGYNNEEIGTIMNRSRSVILRVIQKLLKRYKKAQ